MRLTIICIIIGIQANILAVDIKIDGFIDLESNWNYRYMPQRSTRRMARERRYRPITKHWRVTKYNSIQDQVNNLKSFKYRRMIDTYPRTTPKWQWKMRTSRRLKRIHTPRPYRSFDNNYLVRTRSKTRISNYRTTMMYNFYRNRLKTPNTFTQPKKVKDLSRVNDFMVRIYNQALLVFDNMKKKVNSNNVGLQQKIRSLKIVYKNKFGEFLKKTRDYVIKTKAGAEKVIQNTLDTSNRILRRLMNQISNPGHIDSFQNELNRQMALENEARLKKDEHSTNSGFSRFMLDALAVILVMSNESYILNGTYKITDILVKADFSRGMDRGTQGKFRRVIKNIQTWDVTLMHGMYFVMRTAIYTVAMPTFVVNGVEEKESEKSIAFREFVRIFDECSTSNVNRTAEIQREWPYITRGIIEWKEKYHNNITGVTNRFVALIRKTMNNMSNADANKLKQQTRVMFKDDIEKLIVIWVDKIIETTTTTTTTETPTTSTLVPTTSKRKIVTTKPTISDYDR